MDILKTLKANKLIVVGGGLGIYLAPTITNFAAKQLPSVTGSKLGKVGLNLALGAGLLALGGGSMIPTTAAVAASTPFLVNAVKSGLS